MRYANIDEFETVNGVGCGISLYIQGCWFQCPGCFNSEAWDFNGGLEWTNAIENRFLNCINKPYIKRVSILGGEPLADENVHTVLNLLQQIRTWFPDKTIWLYTGYHVDEIYHKHFMLSPSARNLVNSEPDYTVVEASAHDRERSEAIILCDVVVDGRFEESNKDLSLAFRGSSNQRIIDVQASLENEEIVLYRE